MSKSRIKNAVIVMENDVERLFGEVVEDSRFEKGHHIKTSPLISWNKEKMYGVTESGTYYDVENLFTQDEYRDYVKAKYPEDYARYLLCVCRIKY